MSGGRPVALNSYRDAKVQLDAVFAVRDWAPLRRRTALWVLTPRVRPRAPSRVHRAAALRQPGSSQSRLAGTTGADVRQRSPAVTRPVLLMRMSPGQMRARCQAV
jgi:hypothetical protein